MTDSILTQRLAQVHAILMHRYDKNPRSNLNVSHMCPSATRYSMSRTVFHQLLSAFIPVLSCPPLDPQKFYSLLYVFTANHWPEPYSVYLSLNLLILASVWSNSLPQLAPRDSTIKSTDDPLYSESTCLQCTLECATPPRGRLPCGDCGRPLRR